MGHGQLFQCKKCGYELKAHLGVGFLFPKVYQETVEAAKTGQYGKTVQAFMEEHPDGVLNCDNVLLQCTECGELETEKDLSMYTPKPDVETKETGRWSVAFPFKGALYMAPWDLDKYDLVCHYKHLCKKCGAEMKTVTEEEMEKQFGKMFCGAQKTSFACPKCGEYLWNVGDIMWD